MINESSPLGAAYNCLTLNASV